MIARSFLKSIYRSMRSAVIAIWALCFAFGANALAEVDPANLVLIELRAGVVKIALRPDLAPFHAERIKLLAEHGFYDNAPFHRVIPKFMAQTGDPTGTGTGASSLPDLTAEFSSEKFVRGTVGMARLRSPDTANSQFFIMLGPAPHLEGQYTVIGSVVEGMELVESIKKGDRITNGMVISPDRMVTMRPQEPSS